MDLTDQITRQTGLAPDVWTIKVLVLLLTEWVISA
jgi:hypothetical protein